MGISRTEDQWWIVFLMKILTQHLVLCMAWFNFILQIFHQNKIKQTENYEKKTHKIYCVSHFASGIYTEAFHEEENMKMVQDTKKTPVSLGCQISQECLWSRNWFLWPQAPRSPSEPWPAEQQAQPLGGDTQEGGGSGPTLRWGHPVADIA